MHQFLDGVVFDRRPVGVVYSQERRSFDHGNICSGKRYRRGIYNIIGKQYRNKLSVACKSSCCPYQLSLSNTCSLKILTYARAYTFSFTLSFCNPTLIYILYMENNKSPCYPTSFNAATMRRYRG